jgi:hypothetical protein
MPFSQRQSQAVPDRKIAAEAELQGIPLIESEKKILAFSEQYPESTADVTDEMLEEADEEWEGGIARLFASAYRRVTPSEQQFYLQAKRTGKR